MIQYGVPPEPTDSSPCPIGETHHRSKDPAAPRVRMKAPLQSTALFLAAVAAGLVTVAILLHYGIVSILLILFSGLLVGVLLRGMSHWTAQKTGLSDGWALAAVTAALLGAMAVLIWVAAPRLADQLTEMTRRIPESMEQIRAGAAKYPWLKPLADAAPSMDQIANGPDLFRKLTGVVNRAFGFVMYAVIVLFLGIYVAAEPARNLDGVVSLFPCRVRPRLRQVLLEAGQTLRLWMLGQLVPMAVVGVLTWLGLWLLGVPLAATLGLLAALFNFIPNFGPLISMIPAVLLALSIGPETALYAVLLFLGAQTLEGYVITPLVQRRMVMLPPALTICVQVVLGLLVGGIGVALAAPLSAAALVMVKMLYVEDVLGEEVELPGEEVSSG